MGVLPSQLRRLLILFTLEISRRGSEWEKSNERFERVPRSRRKAKKQATFTVGVVSRGLAGREEMINRRSASIRTSHCVHFASSFRLFPFQSGGRVFVRAESDSH